jgi:hypothetical protein
VSSLAYERLDGKFRLFVLTETGTVDHEGDWTQTLNRMETPWSSCARDIKLRSVVGLPELLGLIADEAERLAISEESADVTVKELLTAISATDQENDSSRQIQKRAGGIQTSRTSLKDAKVQSPLVNAAVARLAGTNKDASNLPDEVGLLTRSEFRRLTGFK